MRCKECGVKIAYNSNYCYECRIKHLRVLYENLKCCGNCAKYDMVGGICCQTEQKISCDSVCTDWDNDNLTSDIRQSLDLRYKELR